MSSAEAIRRELTKLRRRRGVTRSSITRLEKRVGELEALSRQPTNIEHAKELLRKLESLDSEFKKVHFEIVDIIDERDDETWEREQEILDEHDDQVDSLKVRVQLLCSTEDMPTDDPVKMSVRQLAHLEREIALIRTDIKEIPEDMEDISIVEQYELQLSEHKSELREIRAVLITVDSSEIEGELSLHSKLEKALFECSLIIRRLRRQFEKTGISTSSSTEGSGVRLPKLAVPTFDGNILNWRSFWEQFNVSIYKY